MTPQRKRRMHPAIAVNTSSVFQLHATACGIVFATVHPCAAHDLWYNTDVGTIAALCVETNGCYFSLEGVDP